MKKYLIIIIGLAVIGFWGFNKEEPYIEQIEILGSGGTTFGYTSIGATNYSLDDMHGMEITPNITGEATKINTYVVGGVASPNTVQCKIYQSDYSALTNGETIAKNIPLTSQWITLYFSTNPTLTSGNAYKVMCWGNSPSYSYPMVNGDNGVGSEGILYPGPLNGGPARLDWPSTLNSASTTPQSIAYSIYLTIGGTPEIERFVEANTDNSFCYSDGTAACLALLDGNQRLGYRAGADYGNCHYGARFLNIAIPQGATINEAYFKYFAYNTDASTDNVAIAAEATSTSQSFVTDNTSIFSAKNRATTTAFVNWTLPNQTVGVKYLSPDIKTVIQEVIDRDDWSSGGALTIIIRNNGATENHNADSYDDGPAELWIDYSVSVESVEDVSPIIILFE